MTTPELFSIGASQAISILSGSNRGDGTAYYPSWLNGDARFKKEQSISEWFRTVVGDDGSEAVYKILEAAINDQFALFGNMTWKSGNVSFCRLHAIVVLNGDLLGLHTPDDNGPPDARYYRLDYDPEQPGPLFSEPLPHIHCWQDGAPRIPLPGNSGESLPLRFMEFIYLNHFHQDWARWAKSEIEFRPEAELPIESLIEGYNSGSILARLQEFGPHLDELKAILNSAKRDHCRANPFIPENIRMLNYQASDHP